MKYSLFSSRLRASLSVLMLLPAAAVYLLFVCSLQVAAHVDDCVRQGAKVLTGGTPHHELNAAGGLFYNPTVLCNVTRDMLPFNHETFGPLTPLLSFKTEEEAIEIANDTPYVSSHSNLFALIRTHFLR
jgi:hypothetical protein